jgi:hypothetical protein
MRNPAWPGAAMNRHLPLGIGLAFLAALDLACGESREEKIRRELSYENADAPEGNPADLIEKIPPDPNRDALQPLLSKLYSGERLPDVLEADIAVVDDRFPYELTAGAISVVRVRQGLSGQQKSAAIIKATAEADAWVHRDTARRTYADQIHRVMRSFGDPQKDAILKAYADLRLLEFFNSPDAQAAIDALSGDAKAAAEAIRQEYAGKQKEAWDRWMGVKMYARREVSGDEPFKTVLRGIRQQLGYKEPEPVTWEQAHGLEFRSWADEVNRNEELFKLLTNLRELREQEEFRSDTHTIWAVEGSSAVPAKAAGVKIDPELGFGVHREDLGGGFQEMTFVFSRKLSGSKLKHAYLRSHIYRHLHTDFQMLSAAGGDFVEGIVPDRYDPEYAYCGSLGAMDTLIVHFGKKFPLLADLRPATKEEEKILNVSHECIIQHCLPDIKNPDPDDPMDVEGPAPGSRLAFFQMLARFENPDYDIKAMLKEPEKTGEVLDAEAFLKANPNKPI